MRSMATSSIQTKNRTRLAVPHATKVVDVLLYALTESRAAVLRIEPLVSQGIENCHRLSIETNRRTLQSLVIGAGAGDAALARIALLTDLDLLSSGTQYGRIKVRVQDTELDLLIVLRCADGVLSGEARVLSDSRDETDARVAVQVNGRPYPETLLAGTMVGPYKVERVLGKGGMGVVYSVQHTHLRKNFAMKLLAKDALKYDPDSARRFVREALAAARVQHEGIIDVSDFGSLADGRHYLVMQLLNGCSLEDLMSRAGVMNLPRALRLMRDVAAALAAAHAAGIVHRDVTPSNIFVEKVGGFEKIKVVDFGAASIPDPDQRGVPDGPPGMVIGTPCYIAPEHAQALPTDPRTDMYSFGVVLYELVAGDVPFTGDSALDVVMKHIEELPPPLDTERYEHLPREVWLFIERLLAKNPDDRYPTTEAVVAGLDRLIALVDTKGWRRWLTT